jgi:carboxyl-terminal processing protease
MPWDKIDAADYTVWDRAANFNKLKIVKTESKIMHNSN